LKNVKSVQLHSTLRYKILWEKRDSSVFWHLGKKIFVWKKFYPTYLVTAHPARHIYFVPNLSYFTEA